MVRRPEFPHSVFVSERRDVGVVDQVAGRAPTVNHETQMPRVRQSLA